MVDEKGEDGGLGTVRYQKKKNVASKMKGKTFRIY